MAGATTPKPTATAKATAVRTPTSRGRPAKGWGRVLTGATLTGPADAGAPRSSGPGEPELEPRPGKHPIGSEFGQIAYLLRGSMSSSGLEAPEVSRSRRRPRHRRPHRVTLVAAPLALGGAVAAWPSGPRRWPTRSVAAVQPAPGPRPATRPAARRPDVVMVQPAGGSSALRSGRSAERGAADRSSGADDGGRRATGPRPRAVDHGADRPDRRRASPAPGSPTRASPRRRPRRRRRRRRPAGARCRCRCRP